MTGIGSVGGYGLSGAYWYGFQRSASSAGAVPPVTPVKAVPSLPASDAESTVNVSVGTAATAAPTGRPESMQDMLLRYESDPVGMAVRQRIRFSDNAQPAAASGAAGEEAEETKSAAEVMEEAECQTCAKRKYQDGSDDPGVSFKTPAHIAPENAASVVRGHEREHVTREQAAAEREGRKVVQQTVTLHTDICPECGKVYVSGGTTRTTTAADNSETPASNPQEPGENAPFQAVA